MNRYVSTPHKLPSIASEPLTESQFLRILYSFFTSKARVAASLSQDLLLI